MGAQNTITCRRSRPEDAEGWDRFVANHPDGSLYHLSRWGPLVERVFGHATLYWTARSPEGAIAGVLPAVRLRSLLFGDYLVSLPYFNYGGALGRDAPVEEALMGAAAAHAERLGSRHLEFRDRVVRGAWPCRSDKAALELALPADAEVLWKQLGSKLRAQIRRPARENVSVARGGHELVDPFYSVYARNMRDLGTPVYAKRFFAEIAAAFHEHTTILVVSIDSKPVAAGFLIDYKGRMEIPWASSLKECNRFGVNMLMYWEALKTAIERRCTVFDFGRSTRDSGTYRFKLQWGAQPRALFWHYWLGNAQELPRLNPDNPKFRRAVAAWRRLPLPLANFLGPMIVKDLP